MENTLDVVKRAIFKEIIELTLLKKVCCNLSRFLNYSHFINCSRSMNHTRLL